MTEKMAAVINILQLAIVTLFYLVLCSSSEDVKFNSIRAVLCGPNSELFNINSLTSSESWMINRNKTVSDCVHKNGTKPLECAFVFSFCHHFNCSATDKSLMNVTACVNTTSTNKTQAVENFKLGAYDPDVNPFVVKKGSTESFNVNFTNGSPYMTHSNKACNLSMEMTFTCNRGSMWTTQGDKGQRQVPVDPKYLKVFNYDANQCKYLLSFEFDGACPFVTPLPGVDNSLSPGTVLIIMFFVLVSTYFLLGCLYKFFCLGSRGHEIIPHHEFWTTLPEAIADGFMFVCTCCRTPETAGHRYESI